MIFVGKQLKEQVEQGLIGFLAQQRDNFLLWIAIFLGVGAAAYFSLTYEPSYLATGGILTGAFTVAYGGFYRWHRHPDNIWRQILMVVGFALMVTTAGFTLGQFQTWRQGTPMVMDEIRRPVMVSGILEHHENRETGKGSLLIIGDVVIEDWDKEQTPRRVRLTTRKAVGAEVGDKIKVLAKLAPPSPPIMPDDYDFQRHYFYEGIGSLGFVLSDVMVVERNSGHDFFLHNIRRQVAERIAVIVPERQAGIVTALMTGERAAIADEDWQALRVSGLAHIISISGLHVAMVAGPVFFIIRFLLACFPFIALRFPIKKIAAAVALAISCAYVGLVVPSVPTTRALLMTGIALIAVMLDRPPISLRLVALAAIVVLVAEPSSIWSVSFQMSFAAVTALVAVAEAMAPRWSALYREAGIFTRAALWGAGSILTSIVAFIATAPFSLYHFQQFATYSVVANFLSIPISGLVLMPMMILSFLAMPFGLEKWCLAAMGQGVEWLLDLARTTETWPLAQLSVTTPPFMFLTGMIVMGIALLVMQGRSKAFALIPLVVAITAYTSYTPPVFVASGNGKLVALREVNEVGAAILRVSSLKREKFVSDGWRKSFGVNKEDMVGFPREGMAGNVHCDRALCRIISPAANISFGDKVYELKEECVWAHVIVTSARLPRGFCGDLPVRIFDYYTLRLSGAIAIDAAGNIATVADFRGERPWNRVFVPLKWHEKGRPY